MDETAELLGMVIFVLVFVGYWGLVALIRREDKESWRE